MFYNARYYDPTLARFTSADTIVPGAGNPQSLNRYAYVRNNPTKLTDPTGHMCNDPVDVELGSADCAAADGGFALQQLSLQLDYSDAPNQTAGNTGVQQVPPGSGSQLEGEPGTGYNASLSSTTPSQDEMGPSTQLAFDFGDGFNASGNNQAVGNGRNYSVAFEAHLPADSYPGSSRSAHNQAANQQLLAALDSDSDFEQGMDGMIPGLRSQVIGPRGGLSTGSPDDWTWHHGQEAGVMQLVPTIQHVASELWYIFHPGGTGGYSNWGK